MTKFECGCRIMTDAISLNEKPYWGYLLKTYVNICGKCGDRQMKLPKMENMLLDNEKLRMKMFIEHDFYEEEPDEEEDEEEQDGEEDEDFDEEYKEQFRNMTEEEVEKHIG